MTAPVLLLLLAGPPAAVDTPRQDAAQQERRRPLANYLYERPAVGQKAPDFVLTDLQGRRVRLQDLLGKRPVVLELGNYT
jgi:hypothetical protein